MKQLYNVLVTNGVAYEALGELGLGIKDGDTVIVKCERYVENGTITCKVGEPIEDEAEFERKRALSNKGRHVEGAVTPQILRIATAEDLAQINENKVKAVSAQEQTRARIAAHDLKMKLINTRYAFDRKLLMVQFSADGRVDFRELLRDLSTLFRIRVELRQIGVRDEAALLGGIGICGRPFCCSRFLHNFNSINVKMAKQQGISLNPQNISGCCGRLKCCLYYEADAYKNVAINDGRRGYQEGEQDEKALEALDALEVEDTIANAERNGERPERPQGRPSYNGRPRPPRQDNAPRPLRQDNAPRPPRQDNAPRPPRQDNAPRPPRQDNASRPPRQDNGQDNGTRHGRRRDGGNFRGGEAPHPRWDEQRRPGGNRPQDGNLNNGGTSGGGDSGKGQE